MPQITLVWTVDTTIIYFFNYIYLRQGGYVIARVCVRVSLFACLYVGLLATYLKKLWTNFDEMLMKIKINIWKWDEEELKKFWG